jgi:hypothetical protein
VILRTTAAATLCGVSRTTLWQWTQDDVRVRACQFRRGWYSVEKLASLGLCSVPALPAKQVRRSACA